MTEEDQTFASIAREHISRLKLVNVKRAAAHLGVSDKVLYNKLEGKTPFSVEEARDLIGIVPGAALADYVLEKCSFFAAAEFKRRPSMAQDIHDGAELTMIEAIQIVSAYRTALSDGRLDVKDREQIMIEVRDVERSLAGVKDAVEKFKPE